MAAPRYSGLSTINHWITALLVVAMLTLGYAAAAAPAEAAEDHIMAIHVSLGFFAFLVVVWRVGYRLAAGFAAPVEPAAWQRWTAWAVHRLILVGLLVQVVTGPLYLFTEGEGVNVFGWFTVTVPLSALGFIHEPAEIVHVYLGLYLLPAVLLLHLAGAVHHILTTRRDSPAEL